MRHLILSLMMLAALAATAQEITILSEDNPTAQATGDLTKDGIDDLVCIFPTTRTDSIEGNIYALIIYRGSADGTYEPWKSYYEAIQVYEDDNTFVEFSLDIKRGSIHLGASFWSSAGSSSYDRSTFVFRYQDGDFYLIGKELSSFSRMTGEGTTDSYNYLTRKKVTSAFNVMKDAAPPKQKPVWTTLPKEPLKPLSAFSLTEEW